MIFTRLGDAFYRALKSMGAQTKLIAIRPHLSSGGFECLKNSRSFVTYRSRPIVTQNFDPLQKFAKHSDTAIVIQGPVISPMSFTVESVKLYRKIFPGSQIIFSSWEGQQKLATAQIEALGAHVILSSPPVFKGIGSHNLQMTSSHIGIKLAQSLGSRYVLKIRSDQRIHNPYSLVLLKKLLLRFPLGELASKSQENRIVTTSLSSFAYRLFGLSDMIHFGSTEDLLHYWDGSLDKRDFIQNPIPEGPSSIEVAQQNLAETYFMTNFLRGVEWPIEWTLKNYWAACEQLFLVVDAASLDVFWPKYSFQEERWNDYRFPITHQPLDFAFWLGLSEQSDVDEGLLELPEKELGFPLSREARVGAYDKLLSSCSWLGRAPSRG